MSKTSTALAVLTLTGGVLLVGSSSASACAPGYVASKTSCIKIPLPTDTDANRSATNDVTTFLGAIGARRLLTGSRVVRLGATAPGVYTVLVTADSDTPTPLITGTRTVTGTTRKSADLRLTLTKAGKAYVRGQIGSGQSQLNLSLVVTFQGPTPDKPGSTPPAPVITNTDVDLDLDLR